MDVNPFVLALRDALADCCSLPRRLIDPDDRLGELERFMPIGRWDRLHFYIQLQVRLNWCLERNELRLPPFRREATVCEWLPEGVVAVQQAVLKKGIPSCP